MKISREQFEISIIVLLGLVPILWMRPGYIIAKGDYFPTWFEPWRTLNGDISLWSPHNMGNANVMGSFMLAETLWYFLRSLGLNVGFVQILFQVVAFMGAGLSMYYLSKTAYPELRMPAIISAIFYMFNFFVQQSRLVVGSVWTYVFLPLLMALMIQVIRSEKRETGTDNKRIVYFAIISAVAFPIASANPANVVIILLVLGITLLYYLIAQKNEITLLLRKVAKLTVISVMINLWWTIPILNYYSWSPSSTLNPQVSVTAWSWTQARASFLNLFWLNGGWDWRPEYVPYIESYSNPVLVVLTFVPFLLVATALLFKTNRSRFNAYLVLVILVFLFLAKGAHEPLGQVNFLLYAYVPYMTMFREPTSKFTMALMPFMGLLVGYSVHKIATMKIGKPASANFTKLTAVAFAITFMIVSYPLLTGPIDTRTAQLPFSSYVKIPDYWYTATDWLNNQHGDYRILVTPPDDFYMMPYTWGYYGTEEFLSRFVQKPILLTYYQPYRINPDATTTTQYLRNAIVYGKANEFRTLLDVLNIKYILQRNDIQHDYADKDVIRPDEMEAFFGQQPYIHLIQEFGQLRIYEYTDCKPYIYAIETNVPKQITIRTENITTVDLTWNFTSLEDFHEWESATPTNQWESIQTITQDNNTLKAELWNSTWGWKTINSPLLPAQYGDTYWVQIETKAHNARDVHIKIVEYDQNKTAIAENRGAYIRDGTFDWTNTTFVYEPTDRTMKYLQIQVWHGHETDKPLPNVVWISDVQINGYSTILNATGIDLIFPDSTENRPATISSYTRISPIRMTAIANAAQPFILVVSEALDYSWTAYVNGKQIKPESLYLGLAGFYINQTGQLEITIEYEPQKWYYYGSAVSILTFLACITYLTFNWTRKKAIWKRITSVHFFGRKNLVTLTKEHLTERTCL